MKSNMRFYDSECSELGFKEYENSISDLLLWVWSTFMPFFSSLNDYNHVINRILLT